MDSVIFAICWIWQSHYSSAPPRRRSVSAINNDSKVSDAKTSS